MENLHRSTEWRLNNYYYIVDKNSNKTLFNQNSIQRKLNDYKSKRKRILKSRQVGISTNELIKQLDYVLFNENRTACILAHEQDGIEKLFRIVRRAYDFMSPNQRPELDRGGGSKYEMFFPSINSRIYCDLESRGDTINWLHISEKAFIKEINRVKATTECVPLDGIITEETTANGMNHFYEDWVDSTSNYENIFFPWYMHDEYKIQTELTQKDLTSDELKLIQYSKSQCGINLSLEQIAYRRFKQSELKGLFKQEYPEDDITCFLTSGNNVFDLFKIKPLYEKAPMPIKEIDNLKIYEERELNQNYIIAADTAEGVGGDNSCAQVFKVSNRKLIASFVGNLKPSEFADKLVEICELYKPKFTHAHEYHPKLCVERNNHGHAVLLKLDEILRYPNLYKIEDRLGWITDKVTKPIMISALVEGVENGTINIPDRETLGEFITYINKDGKMKAEDGKHDDRVMAAAIGIQLCIEESGLELYHDINKRIRTE